MFEVGREELQQLRHKLSKDVVTLFFTYFILNEGIIYLIRGRFYAK